MVAHYRIASKIGEGGLGHKEFAKPPRVPEFSRMFATRFTGFVRMLQGWESTRTDR